MFYYKSFSSAYSYENMWISSDFIYNGIHYYKMLYKIDAYFLTKITQKEYDNFKNNLIIM